MVNIAIEVGLAALAAYAFVEGIWLDIRRERDRAWRERHRLAGSGPYEPTHDIPRDVDLAVAIADHLRLVYRPLVEAAQRARLIDAINHAFRISLRAAAILARALDQEGSTT